jgi:quercetin dioxygenase-like cupin family protein
MRVSLRGREANTKSEHRTESHYIGECWVDTVLADPTDETPWDRTDETIRVYSVFFQPGHRTDWHYHSKGQFLYVTSGEGRVANDKGQCATICAGDWVYIPAGERHWHGAGPDNFFQNFVISMGDIVYDDRVEDDQYNAGF